MPIIVATMNEMQNEMLSLAKAYCAATGTALSTLGRVIVNDGKFFPRIEAGGSCEMGTYSRVMAWLRDNAPPPGKGKNGATKRRGEEQPSRGWRE